MFSAFPYTYDHAAKKCQIALGGKSQVREAWDSSLNLIKELSLGGFRWLNMLIDYDIDKSTG